MRVVGVAPGSFSGDGVDVRGVNTNVTPSSVARVSSGKDIGGCCTSSKTGTTPRADAHRDRR